MAMRLIKRGARRIPAAAQPGDGWVNVTEPGSSKPYIFPVEDQRITVAASGCGGVRIYDWGKNSGLYTESASGGTLHCATAVVSGVGFGPVVRVLNPTENTEVTIVSELIPPPSCFVERLRAWWGGRHGANQNRRAGRRAHALHRENAVGAQLVNVGTSPATPSAHNQRRWGDARNRSWPVANRHHGGARADLPGRREHRRTHTGYLRLRGSATYLLSASHGAIGTDTHQASLASAGGEHRGA